MATSRADLSRIRGRVGCALADFLGQQRAVLGDIGPDMLPWLGAITELLAGGEAVRPAVFHLGLGAARGGDGPEDPAGAAALAMAPRSAPGDGDGLGAH